MAPQAKVFHQRIAELLAIKKKEEYKDVMNLMRVKLSFALLKSVLVSVRGSRGRSPKVPELPLSCISFNLVPEGLSFVPNRL